MFFPCFSCHFTASPLESAHQIYTGASDSLCGFLPFLPLSLTLSLAPDVATVTTMAPVVLGSILPSARRPPASPPPRPPHACDRGRRRPSLCSCAPVLHQTLGACASAPTLLSPVVMGWGTYQALARPPPRDSRTQGGGAPGVWCSHTGGPRAVRLPGRCSVGEPQRWLLVYWAVGGLHIQHQLRHKCRFYLPF